MELTTVFFMLSGESLFFIVVLLVCLKLAANRHRSHLHKIIEQVNKAARLKAESDEDNIDNKEMTKRLLEKIAKLQVEINNLRDIEKSYNLLKEKEDKQVIVDDQETKADSALTGLQAKKEDLVEASNASDLASKENEKFNIKIQEQRELIKNLKNTIARHEKYSKIHDLKLDSKDRTIAALESMEESLAESQSVSDRLELELDRVEKELKIALNQVSILEKNLKDQSNSERNLVSGDSHSFISKKSDAADHETLLQTNIDKNSEALKKEVELLRGNASAQRRLLFELERQVAELSQDLLAKGFDQEEKSQKELELARVEKLLRETEGCIDVLESEVDYLQDRLNTIAKVKEGANSAASLEKKSGEESGVELSEKLDKALLTINRTVVLREKLHGILELAFIEQNEDLLELLSTRILTAIGVMSVGVHLRIKTELGRIDVANTEEINLSQLDFLSAAIKKGSGELAIGDNGFAIALPKLGVFAIADPEEEYDSGTLDETLIFILMVSQSVISSIEERAVASNHQGGVKKFIGDLRAVASNISDRSKIQSNEIKRVVDDFLKDIHQSLNTLNLSENQKNFYDEMSEELSARLEVLVVANVVEEKPLNRLADQLEKNQAGR